MKALTFPEFYSLEWTEKHQYYTKITGKVYSDTSVLVVIRYMDQWYFNLTQQQFKPELIAELFEYFMFEDNYEDVDGYFYIYVSGHEIEVDTDNATIYYGEYYICGIPRTINEFISDCQRTGIELKWRIK